jgi:hypothetical protein
MMRKVSVGVIASALLVSGGLVGVSFAGAGGITEPQVIELSLDLCGDSCRGFELQDPILGRRGTAWIVVSDDPLFDVDGTRVGHQSEQCTVSYGRNDKGGTPWLCTNVITLKAAPHTEPGTVVTTGIYKFGGETYAVTGGTGAYGNVRGYATMVVVDDREVLTLNLIP